MKNYSEQIRTDIVASAGNTQTMHGTVDGYSDIKIKKGKIIDTSSSADAFSGQSAGDVIKMYGWNEIENNRIFTITEVASDGEWIRVDKELKDETAPSSAGASIETGSEELTVTGVSVDDVIVDAVNFNTSSSSPASVSGRDYMAITAADTVTSFYVADAGDDIFVTWADLSEG
jgi:hypothetical protein